MRRTTLHRATVAAAAAALPPAGCEAGHDGAAPARDFATDFADAADSAGFAAPDTARLTATRPLCATDGPGRPGCQALRERTVTVEVREPGKAQKTRKAREPRETGTPGVPGKGARP